MKKIYLVLAIVGAIIPFMFFIPFFLSNGISLAKFVAALFTNGAAGGFSADVLLSSFVFWIFMFSERKKPNTPTPWIFLVLNLGIGLSCALPAYLYARETKRQEN